MGAWLVVESLFYGVHFAYLLKPEASSLDAFLAFLPTVAASILGIGFVVFAPSIAGRSDVTAVRVDSSNFLRSGLILLGVYWLGRGVFSTVGNLGLTMGLFDPKRVEYSDWRLWVAAGSLVQATLGMILIVIGNRMQEERGAEPQR